MEGEEDYKIGMFSHRWSFFSLASILTSILGNVTSGNVHTARSGDTQCGEFGMDRMVHALCVPIAAGSTNETRYYRRGPKASLRGKPRTALGN